MPERKRKIIAASLAVLLCSQDVIFGTVEAAEIGAQISTGYIYTDNLFLEPTDTVDESIWAIGAEFSYFEETNRSLIDVQALVNHLQYKDSFGGETAGSLAARMDFDIVEDRFSWFIEDNFGQRMPNPLSSPTPDNRENINVFTTGPTLNLGLSTRNSVALEARYDSVTYETSLNDNKRVSGVLSFIRQSNANASLSLNVATAKIEYSDNTFLDEFDVHEAYVGYDLNSVRNIVELDLGTTQLDREGTTFDGFLLRANWIRVVSASSEFQLRAGSQYSTQGDIFRLQQGSATSIEGTFDTQDDDIPFRSNFFLAQYRVLSERTEVELEVNWMQDDYVYTTPVVTPLDRDILGASISFQRDITRATYLEFDVSIRNREYKYIDRQEDDLRAGMTFGYRISDSLNTFITYQYFDRSSNEALQEFVENRFILGIEYTPPWGSASRR